ncbi:HAMP domain-containing protein [Cohnella sp. CFH 77786]|uniref:cache domain-containing sensor histidine kinase n=1 Tax=Cohnella sp. CFH 77786 TaxID=2662265 RepID=UPI001C60F655|nr:sensor histidine kinase [Cohnella sp. CFH 77786]MBW5447952.1 HAMP domain-containing protein [Cohnella sp. CFH 77786]
MHPNEARAAKASFLRRLLPGNLPIRYKLLVHFLLITILPCLALGVMTDWVVNRIIDRQMNDNTQQLIAKVNRTLEFYVGNVQNTTYLLSSNPQIRKFLYEDRLDRQARDDALAFMRSFPTLQTEIAGMMVVNSRGDYLSNDMYARSSQDLTLETWYQEGVAGKGIFKMIGHPVGRSVTTHANYKDSEVVSAVRAVVDPETQKVMGVVLIDLKLRVIVETAQDVRLGKTGLLMVMDERGEPIYVPKQLGFQSIPLTWLKGQTSGDFVETVGGRKLQFIFLKSAFTNWSTIGVFSTAEAAPEVRQIRLYVGTFVFIVCLLGITASFALSHSISRPIYRLMAFMHRAESGDLTTRYWGDAMDEIGMLGRSYNSMLSKISDLLQLTEKQERQKREAELRILQAQIKPHFLYNTLDTIHWMARKQGAEDVAEMVEALSKLFRIGLSKGNEFVPLAEEFDHIRSYLQIQKLRYKDKLKYSLDLDPEIAHMPVLKVILQPIVENAIYHGIKERRGPGRVTVKGEKDEDRVRLTVTDDGAGMDREKLERMREMLARRYVQSDSAAAGSGYGLVNVEARMRLTYGEEGCSMTIESEPGIGTTVSLTYAISGEEG